MNPHSPPIAARTVLELPALRSDELAAIGNGAPQLGGLDETCTHVAASKGKQLRARMVLAAAENGSDPDRQEVRNAAAAVEAIHLASLTHDDVIDEGRERRGAPTAVALFGHRRATIAGNWLVGRSVEMIAGSGSEAIESFARAAAALTEGEMREVASLYNTRCTPEQYFETVKRKTGALFWLSARLGGLLARARPEVMRGLESYGWEFGILYQLADDLLDLLTMEGAADKTGRDLSNGLYTLPVIYALAESEELRSRLAERSTLDDEDVALVVATVRESGALDRTLEQFSAHAREARAAIAELPSPYALELILGHLVDRCVRAA